jgi:3-dehydroquinate dehydratase-1
MNTPSSPMSILIIRGPELHDDGANHPLPTTLVQGLVRRAACAGKTLAVRRCGSTRELLHALSMANHWHVEATLLDPGAHVDSPLLQHALQGLDHPYVEVHDDVGHPPESTLPAGNRRCLAVVGGYGMQGYMLALNIALDHLGAAECECDVHVGT